MLRQDRARHAGRRFGNRAGPLRRAGLRHCRPPRDSIAQSNRSPKIKDPTDNQREVDVDIVDRKNRVLLFAGGPSREYQFLRNMLRRSELAKKRRHDGRRAAAIGQRKACRKTPMKFSTSSRTRCRSLSQYDTIVAFDPDWRAAGSGAIRDGGKMGRRGIGRADCHCRAGVHRRLGASTVDGARFASCIRSNSIAAWRCWKMPATVRTQPWPLDFTREGMEAEFLWLDDSAATSHEVWDSFKGVYGYYRVRGPKLGATTYALYSDPEAADRRSKAGVLRRPVLRFRPCVLHGQRRDVAAARIGRTLL